MSLNFFLKTVTWQKNKNTHYGKFKKLRIGENDLQLILQRASSNKPLPHPIKNGQRLGIESNQKTEMALKCTKEASVSLIN